MSPQNVNDLKEGDQRIPDYPVLLNGAQRLTGLAIAGATTIMGAMCSLHADVIETSVSPNAIDSRTDEVPIGSHHRVLFNPSLPPQNDLVLFLPGTGSQPSEYRCFGKFAASLGHNVICLSYPNSPNVGSACNSPASEDPDCHEKARLEILFGDDVSPNYEIDRHNSIEYRLLSLLWWCHLSFPEQGWDRFYDGFSVRWERILACGHSQGGGHSLYLAKHTKVARAISFAGMDWRGDVDEPAPWISKPFATPKDRVYLFSHLNDEGVDFGAITRRFAGTLGILRYGDHVVAEQAGTRGFRGRHHLATDLAPARTPSEDGLNHNAMIMDADLQMKPDGVTPVVQPAWEHLLTHETKPVRIEIDAGEARVYFSPGTLRFSTDMTHWSEFPYPYTPSPLIIPTDSPAWNPCGFYALTPVSE